jgi:hypothetical protein
VHSDILSNLADAPVYSIIGLIAFVVAFVAVIIWVIRMDRSEIDSISKLPLDGSSAADGENTHE